MENKSEKVWKALEEFVYQLELVDAYLSIGMEAMEKIIGHIGLLEYKKNASENNVTKELKRYQLLRDSFDRNRAVFKEKMKNIKEAVKIIK